MKNAKKHLPEYCGDCLQRFDGKTPQEAVGKLLAHKPHCPKGQVRPK